MVRESIHSNVKKEDVCKKENRSGERKQWGTTEGQKGETECITEMANNRIRSTNSGEAV